LRARIQQHFSPEVMALDAEDRPVSGPGSQLGWMLWAGALDKSATESAVDRLTSADILTPYGLRTLAESHPAFRAAGYHRGAIWPFDNWIAWGGLRRAGAAEAAERVRAGVSRALAVLGRYPELYAVRDGRPEAVPVANRVQAWTVGAVIAFELDWDGHRGDGVPGWTPPSG
jgi:glycogen debranching enzyme